MFRLSSTPARWRSRVLSDALVGGFVLIATGCGDDDDPVAPTPPPPEAPDAPSNFKATSGKGFVEWSWEPVAGARGYYIQISADNKSFDPPDSFSLVSKNSYRFQTSKPTTLFARVRTAAGTLTKPLYSSYTDPVSAKSDETPPPPAVKLDTPDNVSARTPTINSAIISWDEVDDADTYEIQLRAGSAAWSKATCTGTTNPTSNTQCTASGLTHSTQYDFRVRAIPDDDDKTHSTSNWSDTAESTTLVKPTTPATTTTTTGAGKLNLTWLSRGDGSTKRTITWNWHHQGVGVRYQTKVLDAVLDTKKPCEDRSKAWADNDRDPTSYTLPDDHPTISTVTSNMTRLLCVRSVRTTTAGKKEYVEDWAWAAATPSDGSKDDEDPEHKDGVTKSLKWKNISLAANGEIDYDFRYLVDRQDISTDDIKTTATKADLQAKCQSARNAETLTPEGSGTDPGSLKYTTKGDLVPYASYRLCYRASNEKGQSEWAVSPLSENVLYTAPAKVRRVSTISNVRGTGTLTSGSRISDDTMASDTPPNYHIIQWTVDIPANAPKISATKNILTYFDVVLVGSGGKGATGSGTPKTDKPISKSDLDTLSNKAVEETGYHYLVSSGDTTTTATGPDNRLYVGVSIAYSVAVPPNPVNPNDDAAFASLKRTSDTAFVAKSVTQGQDGFRQYNYICVRAKYDGTGAGKDPGPWVCSAGVRKEANKK